MAGWGAWASPFEASYRLALVDRATGRETGGLGPVASGGSVSRSAGTECRESASVELLRAPALGSCLVRLYMDARFAGGAAEAVALGTFVPDAPSRSFDGAADHVSLSLSGRLSELAGDAFERPRCFPAGTPAVEAAASVAREAGLEVVQLDESTARLSASRTYGLGDEGEGGDSKLSAVNDLLDVAGFEAASTDALGRVVLRRSRELAGRPAALSFTEGPGARFLRAATDGLDSSKVANVVRAVFGDQGSTVVGTAVDDSPTSRWSTVARGYRRAATYTFSDPCTQAEADERAARLLATQQSAVQRVELSHAYAPVRPGDAVRVDYTSAGVSGLFCVYSQEMELGPGCLTKTVFRRFVRS